MWVPKHERDLKKGVDSPIPTQVVSNEEFIPRPMSKQQKQVEYLIQTKGEENAKKVGMDRRDFMRSSMGMATAIVASNMVYGPYWEVDAAEQLDPAVTAEKFPKGKHFIIDVQAHFTSGMAIGFRSAEFVKNMGFSLKEDKDSYSFPNFVKEFFYDSDTSMVVISGVPGRENNNKDQATGQPLEGKARGGGILPSWLMAQSRDKINSIAGCQRALAQGNCAPNHYWDKAKNQPDFPALYEQMEREVKQYKIASWKWYCHTDPGRSGNGFSIDDDNAQKFIDKSRELGLKIFSTHKGFAYQSKTLGHLANPKDLEKAALRNPDVTFVVYHSALKHGPETPDYVKANEFDPTTGDFAWHNVLMDIKKRNPQINNLYPEIGSSFGLTAIDQPIMCQHLMGKNIQIYGSDHVVWGTDCIWWGSPQWAIDLLYRFQFTDEMTEKFGYQKLTDQDKANIFGLNAAKIYGVDVNAQRQGIPADGLSKLKADYLDRGPARSNAAYGWVRDDA